MGRTQKGRIADLSKALLRGTALLRDSLWLSNEAAAAEVVKEDWGEVKKVADKVAKEATTIGMLWTQGLKDEDANQALKTYFEGLQALLLLSHACTVGAGPTLLVTIRNAAQQVVNASLTLLTRAVSFSIKGAEKQEREAILPAHVGSVWEACNTLKRTPYTNRAVEAARHVVECSLDFIKQLLYVAADVPVPQGAEESSTGFLENVLKHRKGLGVEVDKFGAYLHPPQQADPLGGRIMKMETLVNLISTQVRETTGSSPEGLDLAFKSLQNAKTELFMLSSFELQEALKLTSISPP